MSSPPSSRLSLPRRGPWIALLSVIVIGAMPFAVCPRLERARAESKGEEALRDLAGCLGAPRDDATLRGRAITAQLDGADWPGRCHASAARLEVALVALARQSPPRCDGRCCSDDDTCLRAAGSRQLLARLRATLDTGRFEDGTAARLLDETAALLAARLPPPVAPSPTAEAGPAEAGPAEREGLPAVAAPRRPRAENALARGGYDVAALVDAEQRWRLLLHARDKHAVICDVDPTASTARCEPLPASIPIADSVLLVDGVPEAPLSILARRDDAVAPERWAIYDAKTGEERLALDHDALGATVSPEGAAAALVHDGSGYFVVAPTGEPIAVERTSPLGPPLLLGPWLVTAEQDRDTTRIDARPLTWTGRQASLGEAEAVAAITAWPPAAVAMQGCRSTSMTAIAVTAEPPGPALEVLVALHDGRRWHAEVVAMDDPWFGLACDDGGATLTDVTERDARPVAGGLRGHYAITQQRCTPSGCRRRRGAIEATRWRPASRYLATSLGDEVALTWRSGLGDVRIAAATPSGLEQASPRSAFEGDDHGGYDFDRHGAELLTRDGWGLLLVADEEAGNVGTHGFLVAGDGTTRPLTVIR